MKRGRATKFTAKLSSGQSLSAKAHHATLGDAVMTGGASLAMEVMAAFSIHCALRTDASKAAYDAAAAKLVLAVMGQDAKILHEVATYIGTLSQFRLTKKPVSRGRMMAAIFVEYCRSSKREISDGLSPKAKNILEFYLLDRQRGADH